jgi:paraquat-inducible protein B
MSGQMDQPDLARAKVRNRGGFSAIWLLPIVALIIGGYLAITTLSERGPEVIINFRTADGLTAGQTKVKHKNVELGTVREIQLAPDMSHVIVHVRMRREAEPYLTDNARFWAVRPRLSASNISGLETLISGGYIELDPGVKEGASEREFTALENPPGVRSDEPGETFVLEAGRIGSLGTGSPVFYRDIVVGEVLGYSLPEGNGPITVKVFVRAPYDKWVRIGTHFWDASGLRVELGGQGVHVQLESLQALLSGGVAFNTPEESRDTPHPSATTKYVLYQSEADANSAAYKQRLPYVLYFQSSVSGLSPGAPVQIYGIQVGNVTGVSLQFDPTQAVARVRVTMEIQPERLKAVGGTAADTPEVVTRHLVARGMRAELVTTNYLTGSLAVSLEFPSNPVPAEIEHEGNAIVLPTIGGGLSSLTASLSDVAQKLDALPFAEIGSDASSLLETLNTLLGGPDVKQAVGSLSGTLAELQGLVRHADAGLAPLFKRLPEMSSDLQQTVAKANRLVGSADTSYGGNSQFQRDLERLMAQLNDTARSIRLLADFLDRHPESLIRGRSAQGADR